MSLRRVGILLGKEFLQGPKNFIFVWAVVAPVVISLVFTLVFGTLFSEKSKLGIVDEGDSEIVTMSMELTSVDTKIYETSSEIREAVERGEVDMGIVLPDGFDNSVKQGSEVELTSYVWGESLAKNRTILGVTVLDLIRELAGQETPVEINSTTLGDEENVPWGDRLLPLVVLMAVFLGGLFLPATSVITEKEKKTLEALVVAPTSLGDIFIAKGLLGIILSLFMGVVILLLNQAFGAEPLLLILVLALGAIMATEIGLLLGSLLKDFTSLFTLWKMGAILLFAPAIVYMFPQIPEWIGKIFPTYYVVQPIVEISQLSGGWSDIATSVIILIGLDLILIGVVMFALGRIKQYAG